MWSLSLTLRSLGRKFHVTLWWEQPWKHSWGLCLRLHTTFDCDQGLKINCLFKAWGGVGFTFSHVFTDKWRWVDGQLLGWRSMSIAWGEMLSIGSYQTVVKQTGTLPVLWAAGGIPLQLRTATTRQPEGLYLGSQPKQSSEAGSCEWLLLCVGLPHSELPCVLPVTLF